MIAFLEVGGRKTDAITENREALHLGSGPNASVAYKPIKLSYKRIL